MRAFLEFDVREVLDREITRRGKDDLTFVEVIGRDSDGGKHQLTIWPPRGSREVPLELVPVEGERIVVEVERSTRESGTRSFESLIVIRWTACPPGGLYAACEAGSRAAKKPSAVAAVAGA